ncbi:MAG: plasmid stability protein [bacterium]
MTTITLKNVPQKLHADLKKSAGIHRRSLNNEAIIQLERALLTQNPITEDEVLEQAKKLRDAIKVSTKTMLTEKQITTYKNWGKA